MNYVMMTILFFKTLAEPNNEKFDEDCQRRMLLEVQGLTRQYPKRKLL